MQKATGQQTPNVLSRWYNPARSLVFFCLLVLLPALTIGLILNMVQNNLAHDAEQQDLDEMAEMTAHMARLANHETYYQETLRRVCDSFRWASSTQDIARPAAKNILELFLFDSNGVRLSWPDQESEKRKMSEDYMQILLRLRKEPHSSLTRREQNIAATFSGNQATVHSLARSPDTLVSFQGLGMRRYGAWFEFRLPGNMGEGHLLAWMFTDEILRYQLAENAIQKIGQFAGKNYVFAWIDLNNPDFNSATDKRTIRKEAKNLLATEGLKSGFRIKDELVAISDTPEGIRLIGSRHVSPPPPFLNFYFDLLRITIPVFLLFMIWKTVFLVRLDLSAGLQFSLIFGFTALAGILILFTGTLAYQYEKQNSLVGDYKQRAVEILEKVDRNFTSSYGDLIRQYRHLNQLLKNPQQPTEKILEPLAIAQADDNIAFASYSDAAGNFLFKAPDSFSSGNANTIESKYANLISGVSSQLIKTFNSSRSTAYKYTEDPLGMTSITAKPVEGLLANRSALQNITFDGDETLTFLELTVDENDTASGCLFIVHEPRKMQLSYLAVSASKLSASTGFTLAAFPKRHADRNAYYPRYSLTTELPLWKLQDLINQTQVSSFKQGRIEDVEVLVAAIPGHNLRNYNLFLIMPFEPIRNEAGRLSGIFVLGSLLALIFITFLGLILTDTLIQPISMLAANATALQRREPLKSEEMAFSESNELESISTGLTDLILKVREFNEGRSIKRHLLPPEPMVLGKLILDGFQISKNTDEKEIYHFAKLEENLGIAFLMRTDLSGIEASLTLSMTRMAVRLISEELNLRSPFQILKDLEEYFRINLRRRLTGDFFLMILDMQEKKISYSGCGAIKLAIGDLKQRSIEVIDLPPCEIGSSEFYNYGKQEADISDNSLIIALSPVFAENCQSRLQTMMPALALRQSEGKSIRTTLQKEAEANCGKEFKETASLITAYVSERQGNP
ncbi:MAG: hypothetical protein CVV42_04720 [Candidatus Riflebacteria bacterium HGW-Riflebacteria-2]|jgi:hypothetical protein|nr:MAG: hypothetical protein CVV42_04720 [Candidatus Riflebacteria bacterium HGW-Riflebacteria-2]